jgi:hypothetical protein
VRVHLIAACGVGMSALAGLLRAAGHHVTGSDEHVYPPASTLLEELGIPVFQGYDPARLAGVDLVVCGNAVRRTNAEAAAAEAGGLRMLSMPAVVEEMFLAGRSPLVVASLDDVLLDDRPQNVPGTGDERPNWRIRSHHTLEDLGATDEVRRVLERLTTVRVSSHGGRST